MDILCVLQIDQSLLDLHIDSHPASCHFHLKLLHDLSKQAGSLDYHWLVDSAFVHCYWYQYYHQFYWQHWEHLQVLQHGRHHNPWLDFARGKIRQNHTIIGVFIGFVCLSTPRPFMGPQALNLAGRQGAGTESGLRYRFPQKPNRSRNGSEMSHFRLSNRQNDNSRLSGMPFLVDLAV